MATLATPPTSEFKLSDAISHLNSQNGSANQVWAFYTATILGSLILGVSHRLTPVSATIFLCGFWAFALGEFTLLRKYLQIGVAIRAGITARLAELGNDSLGGLRECLAVTAHEWRRPWLALVVQLAGDLCVTGLIMANAAGRIPVS